MKFLVHSNAPHVRTGYGVQAAHLLTRLARDGHEVAASSTYGQQGGMGKWITPDGTPVALYPNGYDQNGNDVVHFHAHHFFGGNPLGGWVLPIIDVWCLVNPILRDFNIAAWTPVDHFPVPPDVRKFFHRTGAVPVAMSRFGERLLLDAGLDPVYVPLSVDTNVYKPTPEITIGDRTVTGREMIGVPEDAYVVGMVAMNKGNVRDRKGFNEAFRAFGVFWRTHQNAVLYVHSDWPGAADGFNLKELATHCAIPPHAIVFPELYAYFPHGFTAEQMAAMYSAFDVLLAPSHGEGFCVPLIEAQACGTPVIATDFSAQTELVGSGWLVEGQPEWDHHQQANYVCPSIVDVVLKLEEAHQTRQDIVATQRLTDKAVEFAAGYDTDHVYDTYWRPLLELLDGDPSPVPLSAGRTPMDKVAVIVPFMREENWERLVESFDATNDGTARLVLAYDSPPSVRKIAGASVVGDDRTDVCTGKDHTTYAEKVNLGLAHTHADWLLLVGDDVEFKPGWLEAARKLSDRFDVIGTNDSSNGVKNPEVAAGRHADHFFVRRSYIEEHGACLDGPGVLAPEAYRHWYVDREIIELAKARGVFTPCLDSVIEHHHPGYEGKPRDGVYLTAIEHSAADEATWKARHPLVRMQRRTLAKQ